MFNKFIVRGLGLVLVILINVFVLHFLYYRLEAVRTSVQRSSGSLISDEIANDLVTGLDEAVANLQMTVNGTSNGIFKALYFSF